MIGTMFDLQTPFLKPLWRRVAITVVTLLWALVEIAGGNVGWAVLFGAAGLWCGYQFFVVWDPETVDARAAAQRPSRREDGED